MGQLIRSVLTLGLVLLASISAHASSLDSLLSAHADSMGLSRQKLDDRCWHLVENITGLGLTGTVETWAQPPAAVRSLMQLGPLTVESWFDGQRGWLSDRNGASREAAGSELDGMLVQALFSTGAWLLENPPVPLAFARDDSAGTDSTLVIICEPLLDSPLRIELDTRSLLPISTTFHTADGEQKQSFEKWIWYDGFRVSSRSRLDLAGLVSLETRLISVEHLAARPREFFHPRGDEPGTTLPDDIRFSSPLVEAPLIEDTLHLTIQGFITNSQGQEISVVLLVDTGAGANFLDAGVARRLGLEGEGEVPTLGVGGHAESRFVNVPALRIGDVQLLEQSWMESDFTTIRSWFANPPAAVLGYDFLSRTVMEIDYAGRTLRFHEPGGFEAPPEAIAIPLRMDANIPTIEVLIEGHPGWVHLDTGSNGALDLAQPFVEKFGMLEDRETELASGLRGVGGTARTRRGTVDRLEFGGLVLENVSAGFSESGTGIFSRDDIAGIIGAELLSRFHCFFDYPGQTLWLVEP
jgi:hypothetical protein